MNIKEIALEILHKYEDAEGSVIYEHGGLHDEDYLCLEVEKYKEQIENAIIDQQPHWIPCSERLPEPNQYDEEREEIHYLVQDEYGDMMIASYNRDKGETWWEPMETYTVAREKIVAWMPLPEPYKG